MSMLEVLQESAKAKRERDVRLGKIPRPAQEQPARRGLKPQAPQPTEDLRRRLSCLQDEISEIAAILQSGEDEEEPPKRHVVFIHQIIAAVSSEFRIKRAAILSPRRWKDIALARHVGMYLATELTPHSLKEIGRRFGGRDHTTVLNALQKVRALRLTDESLNLRVTALLTKLGGDNV